MRNTHFEFLRGDRQVQLQRIRRVMQQELTPLQQLVLQEYYLLQHTIPQIARDRGVHKSTVCRTLHRAENKLRRYLQY